MLLSPILFAQLQITPVVKVRPDVARWHSTGINYCLHSVRSYSDYHLHVFTQYHCIIISYITVSINGNQCQSMSSNVNQCQLMSINVNQCQAMSTNVNQCQLMSININQCQAMSSNVNQCQPMPTNVNQCQPMSTNVNQCWFNICPPSATADNY